MAEFKAAYLPKGWEDIMRIKLLQLNQMNESFWDYSVAIQYKNSLLLTTDSHMTDKQLHHHIKSGMQPKLALCEKEKLSTWLDEMSRINKLMRNECMDVDVLAKPLMKAPIITMLSLNLPVVQTPTILPHQMLHPAPMPSSPNLLRSSTSCCTTMKAA